MAQAVPFFVCALFYKEDFFWTTETFIIGSRYFQSGSIAGFYILKQFFNLSLKNSYLVRYK